MLSELGNASIALSADIDAAGRSPDGIALAEGINMLADGIMGFAALPPARMALMLSRVDWKEASSCV